MEAPSTPSQTIGPFFGILLPLGEGDMAASDAAGAVEISGQVFDGAGAPVTDALLEVWQANSEGRYAHPADMRELRLVGGFTGFGRYATDIEGGFRFRTVKPGRVAGAEGEWEAPHINVSVFARGLLNRLVTRIYFPDEEAANSRDPLLASIADPAVQATLVAKAAGRGALRFDIRLQGEGETAFLEV